MRLASSGKPHGIPGTRPQEEISRRETTCRKMQDRRQDFNTRVEALKLGMDDELSCDRGAGQNPSTGPQQGDPGAGETGAG